MRKREKDTLIDVSNFVEEFVEFIKNNQDNTQQIQVMGVVLANLIGVLMNIHKHVLVNGLAFRNNSSDPSSSANFMTDVSKRDLATMTAVAAGYTAAELCAEVLEDVELFLTTTHISDDSVDIRSMYSNMSQVRGLQRSLGRFLKEVEPDRFKAMSFNLKG